MCRHIDAASMVNNGTNIKMTSSSWIKASKQALGGVSLDQSSPSLPFIGQSVTIKHSSNKPISQSSPQNLASQQYGSVTSALKQSNLITSTVLLVQQKTPSRITSDLKQSTLVTSTIPQEKTSSLIVVKTLYPSTSSVTTMATTSAESKSSVSGQANDNSTSISSSLATTITITATPSSSISKVIITSHLTSLPYFVLNSSSSEGIRVPESSYTTRSSSVLTTSFSGIFFPHISSKTPIPSTLSVPKATSYISYSTSHKMKVNQTNTTNSIANLLSSTVKVNHQNISSVINQRSSSAKHLLNTSTIYNTSAMTNTSISVPSSVNVTPSSTIMLRITSTPSSLNISSRVTKPIMPSTPSQSPAVFASSVVSPYNPLSTARTGASCHNNSALHTCITLKPSPSMKLTTTNSGVIMSNSLSSSFNNTSSFAYTTKGTRFINLFWS